MLIQSISAVALFPAEALPLLKPDAVAGFPSPADGFSETPLNLQQLLIQRPAATYFIRVHGHSMTAAGIFSGDLLIVDRSLVPGNDTIVVAIVEGAFVVKRYCPEASKLYLRSENPGYPAIEITGNSDFQVWGVVTYVIHQVQR